MNKKEKKDKKTEKERDIYVIGRPSIENLSDDEKKIFYKTLLSCIIDYYKSEPKNQ